MGKLSLTKKGKIDYWKTARKLYLIMQKDWTYASNKNVELHQLKAILKLIPYERLEEICKYVYENKDSTMRNFRMIRKYLDELVEETTKYDPLFEMQEGYKYNNRVLKRKAYEKWLKERRNKYGD